MAVVLICVLLKLSNNLCRERFRHYRSLVGSLTVDSLALLPDVSKDPLVVGEMALPSGGIR